MTTTPDTVVSNSADFDADSLLGVLAKQCCTAEVLAPALLEFARWLTDWSPPTSERLHPAKKQSGPGTDTWRRKHFRKAGA